MRRCLLFVFFLVPFALAQHDHAGMDHSGESAAQSSSAESMDHAVGAMSHRHMEMGAHMKLTEMRPLRPGDKERADAIVQAAKDVMERYADYHDALADGFRIFL